MKKVSVLFFVFLFCAVSSVYTSGIPRPIVATDTQPLGKGKLLAEGGVDYLKNSLDAKQTDIYAKAGFGITPRWDVFLEVPYTSIDSALFDESGAGDVLVETSFELTSDQEETFGCNIGAEIKVPTADDEKGLGTGKEDYTGYFAFSSNIYDALGVFDLSYTHRNSPTDVDLDNFWEAIAELQFTITPATHFSFALLGDFYNERDNNYECLEELDLYINEMSKLNLLVGAGLDDHSNDLRAGLNIQILF